MEMVSIHIRSYEARLYPTKIDPSSEVYRVYHLGGY